MAEGPDEVVAQDFPATRWGASRRNDPLLKWIVHFANSGRWSLNLTVVVPGAVIRGHVVARNTWLQEWRTQVGEFGADSYSQAFEMLQAEGSNALEDELEGDFPVRIHMRDASINGVDSGLTRIEIRDVSAWTLGERVD